MKSIKEKISVLMMAVTMTVAVSCENMEIVNVTEITLNKDYLNLPVNGTEALTATVKPDNAANKSIYWKSSHPELVTVDDNGMITAVAVTGQYVECVISVSAKDNRLMQATCRVEVYAPVTGVTLQREMSINSGSSYFITPTFSPVGASFSGIGWRSSNTAVATVVPYGERECILRGVTPGTATITVTVTGMNGEIFTAESAVTVQ
jgi:uncharacterized protein YjdB